MKIISSEFTDSALALYQSTLDEGVALARFCRNNWGLVLLVVTLFVLGIWYAKPMPPFHVKMSAGSPGSSYSILAQKYADYLAQNGVRLEIVDSTGAMQNLERVKDPESPISVAFIQSGIVTGNQTKGLLSLGSVDYEPVWFFYQHETSASPSDQLKDYLSEPIALGNTGSGTQVLALKLLALNGVTDDLNDNPNIVSLPYEDYAKAVQRGEIKAVFLIDGIDSENVQSLLNNPAVKMRNFIRADAYTRRLPFLHELVIPMGGLNLERNLPDQDVKLIATTTNLIIDKDLHPAIQMLFLQAAQHINGQKNYFAKQDEFPSIKDGTIPPSKIARQFYERGAPVLMNYMPFWLSAFIERVFWLLVPFTALAAFLYPFIRSLPALRLDRMRTRILTLHMELNDFEGQLLRSYSPATHAELVTQLERIASRALELKVTSNVALEYSTLRGTIDHFRNWLHAAERNPVNGLNFQS
jgi:TRAP-type uncharacterized transport system substrate-binding protein